jgi:hypothetical protein
MPLMTDVRAVAVFRFFRRYQLVFASHALYSKSGAAIWWPRRHENLLDPDPTKNYLTKA